MLGILIKPVSSQCQMACEYCFYRDESKNREKTSFGNMSEEILETIIKKAFAEKKTALSFLFQGGEPLLAGKPFFKKIVEFQKKYNLNGIETYNSVQTNGLLIDDEWCSFFRENHFLVGISIDGTKKIQDKYRKNAQGKSFFEKIAAAAKTLKKNGVEFSVLSVVTNETVPETEKIYHFFRESGFLNLQFIPCIEPFDLSREFLSKENYGIFLVKIFDLWYNDLKNGTYVSIRHIENYIRILFGITPEECGTNGKCQIQFVTESDGSVFPCDFFALDKYLLGNIVEKSFAELLNSQNALKFLEETNRCDKAKIKNNCVSCEAFPFCKNGCFRYRNDGLNIFCESYKYFFKKRKDRLFKAATAFATLIKNEK